LLLPHFGFPFVRTSPDRRRTPYFTLLVFQLYFTKFSLLAYIFVQICASTVFL